MSRADLLFKRSVVITTDQVVNAYGARTGTAAEKAAAAISIGNYPRTSSMEERIQKVLDALGLTDAVAEATQMAKMMSAPIEKDAQGAWVINPGRVAAGISAGASMIAEKAIALQNLYAACSVKYEEAFYEMYNDGATIKDAHNNAFSSVKHYKDGRMAILGRKYKSDYTTSLKHALDNKVKSESYMDV